MSKQHLYLFVGFPGAGKTTISQLIEERIGAVHIWADHERQKMFGSPDHSWEESEQLYKYLNDMTANLMAEGKSVVFDTNFNFKKDREYLREIASRNGAETTVVWVNTPKELAKKRAVEDSHGKKTRLYGNMSEADFDRIASHLQPPDESENVIKIDGTEIDRDTVIQLLNL